MSGHPTSMKSARACAAMGTIIASLATAGVASAAEPVVTEVSGNPSCAYLGSGFTEIKIEPVRQGRTLFAEGDLSGSITVKGAYFDFSVTPGVVAVIVKGGPTANVYKLLCYLQHLELEDEIERLEPEDGRERWRAAS
jgi:hypothetical protein